MVFAKSMQHRLVQNERESRLISVYRLRMPGTKRRPNTRFPNEKGARKVLYSTGLITV